MSNDLETWEKHERARRRRRFLVWVDEDVSVDEIAELYQQYIAILNADGEGWDDE